MTMGQCCSKDHDSDGNCHIHEPGTPAYNAWQVYDRVAKLAYDAYAVVTGGKNYAGLPMPQYADLPGKIKEAWHAAILVAGEEFENDHVDHAPR